MRGGVRPEECSTEDITNADGVIYLPSREVYARSAASCEAHHVECDGTADFHGLDGAVYYISSATVSFTCTQDAT